MIIKDLYTLPICYEIILINTARAVMVLLPCHGEPCSPVGGSLEADCIFYPKHTCEAVCQGTESLPKSV